MAAYPLRDKRDYHEVLTGALQVRGARFERHRESSPVHAPLSCEMSFLFLEQRPAKDFNLLESRTKGADAGKPHCRAARLRQSWRARSAAIGRWPYKLQQCLFDFFRRLLLFTGKSGLVLFRRSCGLWFSGLCGRRCCDSDCSSDLASSRSNGLGCRYEHSFGRLRRFLIFGHMSDILARSNQR